MEEPAPTLKTTEASRNVVMQLEATAVQTMFDPEVVRQYASMVSDAPERILKQFEKNAESEREDRIAARESLFSVNELRFRDSRRRDWMAFGLIALALMASAFFAFMQLPWLAGASFAAVVGYVALGFFKWRDK